MPRRDASDSTAPKVPRPKAAKPGVARAPAAKARDPAVVHPSPAAVRPLSTAAVPVAEPKAPVSEPVWLVRIVLVLFFVGFAAFLAREVYSFVQALP